MLWYSACLDSELLHSQVMQDKKTLISQNEGPKSINIIHILLKWLYESTLLPNCQQMGKVHMSNIGQRYPGMMSQDFRSETKKVIYNSGQGPSCSLYIDYAESLYDLL